ncbi:MAG: thiamine pyrophosphate-binding protein [Alphaproteobacteria bacterium]
MKKENNLTIAKALMRFLKSVGVKNIYGVPGGGSSLDLIDAAEENGINFFLVKREDNAVIMASVSGDLTNTIGVALVTKGPGLSNAMNGIAYACLDRSPLILFSDGFSSKLSSFVTHQVFDQKKLMSPFSKGYSNLNDDNPLNDFQKVVSQAFSAPYGPVYIELITAVAQKNIEIKNEFEKKQVDIVPTTLDIDKSKALLLESKKPVIVLGLENLRSQSFKEINDLLKVLNCPVFVTYKAKGVVADSNKNFVGIFTGGKVEQACILESDLIILIGLDPVELILQPWPYNIPVLNISVMKYEIHYVKPSANLYGNLSQNIKLISEIAILSDWVDKKIDFLKKEIKSKLFFPTDDKLNPQSIVELAQKYSVTNPRVTVDAGAHMFSATAFWKCKEPYDLLISNGLATMGYALPAAIAASIENNERGAIAFTGDGGFMMCCSELATAAQFNCNILVIVFNDGALSLIDIKQKSRNLTRKGTTWPQSDFAKVAEGFGCKSWRVSNVEDYKKALIDASQHDGPKLIDVLVNPEGYSEQLKSLRG